MTDTCISLRCIPHVLRSRGHSQCAQVQKHVHRNTDCYSMVCHLTDPQKMNMPYDSPFHIKTLVEIHNTVAYPGFPGEAPISEGRHQPIIWQNLCRKLRERNSPGVPIFLQWVPFLILHTGTFSQPSK